MPGLSLRVWTKAGLSHSLGRISTSSFKLGFSLALRPCQCIMPLGTVERGRTFDGNARPFHPLHMGYKS